MGLVFLRHGAHGPAVFEQDASGFELVFGGAAGGHDLDEGEEEVRSLEGDHWGAIGERLLVGCMRRGVSIEYGEFLGWCLCLYLGDVGSVLWREFLWGDSVAGWLSSCVLENIRLVIV
jgi:hypothetical protein